MPTERTVTPAVDSPSVSRDTRLRLFHVMLLQRLVEDRTMALYRQGRIVGSVYTGRGQEGVAAAAGLALGPDDVVAPLNREQACHYARGVTVADVFRNFLGKATGPTRGRDGNMHFGKPEVDVFPLVSMLGILVPVTVGAALAFKRRRERRVALTFMGDGQFCVGDVHEGLNLAGVLRVPAVFVVQSNQYAYSTPTSREMLNTDLSERIRGGWSIPCGRVDGTDAIATYEAIRDAVERARAGEGPQAIEAVTLRGHGHAAHDDARYVPDELRARFADPIERLAARLLVDGLTEPDLDHLLAVAQDEVARGLEEAEAAPAPDPRSLEDGVYATPVP
ncbi:MAG: thiamine pyrophosphate-dependent dehydrogenase E1 component subunit alpha [Gaiellales bacterium]